MSKLNNKGTTLIEIIISFSLLTIMISGLTSIIVMNRKNALQKDFEQTLRSYNDNIIVLIEEDIINNKLVALEDCSGTYLICKNLVFLDNSKKELIIDKESKVIRYDNLIYNMPDKDKIEVANVDISLVDNLFKMEVPIYQKNNITNYGIKITAIINL